MNPAGKTFSLTGASGGIGSALARQLAERDARLLLCGRQAPPLEKLLDELPGSGHQMLVADLTTGIGRARVTEACRQNKQPLDALIHCAGFSAFKTLAETAEADIEQTLNTNLLAPLLLTRALLPQLLSRDRALIVNLGSSFGGIGYPGFSAYCASKSGLRGFSEALRRELGDSGVRVLHIAPRATRTAFNPDNVIAMNRALKVAADTPETVAALIIHAIERETPDTWIGWPEKFFVRLNALLPSLVDNAIARQLATILHHTRNP